MTGKIYVYHTGVWDNERECFPVGQGTPFMQPFKVDAGETWLDAPLLFDTNVSAYTSKTGGTNVENAISSYRTWLEATYRSGGLNLAVNSIAVKLYAQINEIISRLQSGRNVELHCDCPFADCHAVVIEKFVMGLIAEQAAKM